MAKGSRDGGSPLRRLLYVLLLAVSLHAAPGCSIIDHFFVPEPEETAQELYDAARIDMGEGRYRSAAKKFSAIKDRYPFSPYAMQAELNLGEALFLNGNYLEAVDAYSEFENLHPSDENIPFVLLQMGKANLKSFKTIDRPMTRVEDALAAFTRLRDSYPESRFAAEADEYIVKCRTLMADHELFVADFYWNSGRYSAAWKRYNYVAETFKDLPQVAAYAEKRSRLAYYEHQREWAEERRRDDHGSWRRWLQDWL